MTTSQRSIALAFCLAIAAIGQQSQTQQPTQQPQAPPDKEKVDLSKIDASSVGQAVDPRSYIIGPEDIIFVRVWRQPDFTGPHIVRSDGKISLPLFGEIDAANKTPDVLSKDIAKALTEYVNKPDVSVSIQQVNSKKFFVNGEVLKPGPFPLVGKITVLEALSMAGGFREFANRKKITILRKGQIFKFNWMEVSQGKKMEQNIGVENGDQIFVK